MYARSPAFADEFALDGVLVGSEPGEVARGRAAIASLIATFHALPARYTWAWDAIDLGLDGPMAWLFAEGFVVKDVDGNQTRKAYRLSGVLAIDDGAWRWRLFHGSEPQMEA